MVSPQWAACMMHIDWTDKLQRLLQVLAFALGIATIQFAFMPERPYGPPLVYSLLIASITWAVIDLGRELFPSSAETGWPTGWSGWLLPLGGIALGYLLGSWLADALCVYYGWYAASAGHNTQSTLRYSLLVTALAGIAGTYLFYARSKSAYLRRKMGEAHQHASEARLKLLQSQLEPHMLFNTLANLRALIATDPERATAMLDRLNDYLRATLSGSLASTHTLQAEFDRLRDYLELMAVRMGPRLHYTLDLPPDLAAQPVPPLLLQPLIENSIKHGLEPKVEGGSVRVSARLEGSALRLEVTDTGVGFATEPEAGKGFGLTQVRERLKTTYGSQAAISFVANSAGGTSASITFPFEKEK